MHKNIEYIMVLVRRVPNKKLSWYLRCIKRLETIVELDKNTWYLRPLPKLGDRRQYYIVRYDEKTESFTCTCYDKSAIGGSIRKLKMCTHVGAVILKLALGS
ncbi:MAG: hypothetical protein DRJ32_04890 [Thermoprotei archaeon]|nr:MAG: hypothetical protein B6U94_07675 [Thermofilum sp. ex4484_79]RLE59307.1 MAG: hypothetical protein DRJ32_04890 [Thermoprotei archaeon]